MKKFILGIAIIFCFIFLPGLSGRVLAGNPPDQGNSKIDATIAPADGLTSSTVTIVLKDTGGNTLSSQDSILITSSDSTTTFNPSSVTLDGSGTFTTQMKTSTVGNINITVTDQTTGGTPIIGSALFYQPGTTPPTPTPTPAPGQCTASAPSAPTLVSAASKDAHSVTINWNAVTPATYYLVSYGIAAGNYIYGNPNVGYVTSYTVGSLVTGKTYYFAVKAVNDCMPGAYSNELSAAPGVTTETPTPTTETSVTSSTDQTDQIISTNQTLESPTETPTPTEGPPITPVPKSGPVAQRTVVFVVIGVLLAVSVIAVVIINVLGRKPKSPTEPFEPPVFDSDQSTSFDKPHGGPEEPNQTNEEPPTNDPSRFS